MTNDERVKVIDSFKGAKGGSALTSQIKCGGVGLNLQTASVVHILSPPWSPATTMQAIGRSWRSGQTDNVKVFHYISRTSDERNFPSIDLTILALQEQKLKLYGDYGTTKVAKFGKHENVGSMKTFFNL